MLRAMRRAAIERKLRKNVARQAEVREELAVAEAQLQHFADVAGDAEVRALVSESPVAASERRQADRSAGVMRRHRDRLRQELTSLLGAQDELLDELADLDRPS